MLETPSSHRVVTNEGLAAAVEQAQRGVQDPVLVEQAMLGSHAIELRRHPPDPEAQERMKHWNRELDRRQVKSDEV
jgi:thioredoxin reductase